MLHLESIEWLYSYLKNLGPLISSPLNAKNLQDTFFSQPLIDTQLKKTSASASHTLFVFLSF